MIFIILVLLLLFQNNYLRAQTRVEGQSAAAPFTEYRITSDTARFSVVFPGKPFHADSRDVSEPGIKREIIYQKDYQQTEITYYSFASILLESRRPSDVREFLREKADNYHIKWDYEPATNNPLEYQGLNGREVETRINDKYNMRVWLFYRDSIFYEFSIVGPPDSINGAPGNAFLKSIEFLD